MKLRNILTEAVGRYMGPGKLNNLACFILGMDHKGNYIIQFFSGVQMHDVRPKDIVFMKNSAPVS